MPLPSEVYLMGLFSMMLAVLLALITAALAQDVSPPTPVVEVEEEVYTYTPADNGAWPMWCFGNTCLARCGERLFASGIETLPNVQPLNNVRWMLFERMEGGWQIRQRDETHRTREPCPLVVFPDGRLFLSVNPTLTSPDERAGPARPQVLQFSVADPMAPFTTLLPTWDGEPPFTEHSYRSFVADGKAGELFLLQNVGYTHAEWAFRDASGEWSAQGKLIWPWGAEYDTPQPIRLCYPVVALHNRAVYFCGVSDIVEPYTKWREAKKEITGRDWDYDFRRLFFTWCPNITQGEFSDWLEVASRDKTCGWITPCDLWIDGEGVAHVLWTERALDERLRERFFPGEKQTYALNYTVIRNGQLELRRTLALGGEGLSGEVPGMARFQVTEEGRVFVCYYVSGTTADGKSLSENRVFELLSHGATSAHVRVPLKHPMSSFFTTTLRGGSPPSRVLEMLGPRADASRTICYARVRLL
ncbi:MAG: hypothetical protein ACUVX8_04080 [Candidatus Zipacnadales bacterium]